MLIDEQLNTPVIRVHKLPDFLQITQLQMVHFLPIIESSFLVISKDNRIALDFSFNYTFDYKFTYLFDKDLLSNLKLLTNNINRK